MAKALRHSLCVVLDDMNVYNNLLKPLIVDGLFNQVLVGSFPKDFKAATNIDDPLIFFIQGKQSAAVIKELAEETKRVKWVHSFLTGVDNFRLHEIADIINKHQIPISNTRDVFARPLAEHVVYSCLYFNRQMWRIMSNKHNKVYERFINKTLSGQRVGIAGYGNIGKECAKALRSFNVKVTGLKSKIESSKVDEYGVDLVSGKEGFDKILKESDFVLNILPFTKETNQIFNRSLFSKMRKDAVFINIGRGKTVVEPDLIEALEKNVIAGAALDVFDLEPIPSNSPLWLLGDDKLLLTPHNADITNASFVDATKQFVALAYDYINFGKLPSYLVDVKRGY